MKTFSSIVAGSVYQFTTDDIKEDSKFPYYDIGWLSANFCFPFMDILGLDTKDDADAYTFVYEDLCRFLKGTIPAWRLSTNGSFSVDSEAYRHALTLRRFIRAARAERLKPSSVFVLCSLMTGKSCVFQYLGSGKTLQVD